MEITKLSPEIVHVLDLDRNVIIGDLTFVPNHIRVSPTGKDEGITCPGRIGRGIEGGYLEPHLRCNSCGMFWV